MSAMIHQIEADHDSFGNILQPQGLEDLMESIQCEWHARAVMSGLNQRRAQKMREEAVIGEFMAIENVYDTHHFFDAGLARGFDCWHDEEFINDSNRNLPESRVKAKPRRVSLTVSGFRDRSVEDELGESPNIIVPATKYTRIEPRPQAATQIVAKAPEVTRIVAKTH